MLLYPVYRVCSQHVRKALLTVLLLLLTLGAVPAQYHLSELGIQAGGGLHLPVGAAYHPSWTATAGGFYSHYVCGKNWGWHLTAGLMLIETRESRDTPPSLWSADHGGQFTHRMMYAEVAGMFKLRRKNYHRDQESALLIGPWLRTRILAQTRFTQDQQNRVEPLDNTRRRNVARVLPGLRLACWFSTPVGNKQRLFLSPAVDYTPTTTAEARNTHGFTSLRMTFELGISLWSNI